MAQLVKNLPIMWDTLVQSLGWEDPLKKGTATYSSILAWRIPWVHKKWTRVSNSLCPVATGLEKVSFHSNLKEGQFQRMFKLPHNCTHPISNCLIKILEN